MRAGLGPYRLIQSPLKSMGVFPLTLLGFGSDTWFVHLHVHLAGEAGDSSRWNVDDSVGMFYYCNMNSVFIIYSKSLGKKNRVLYTTALQTAEVASPSCIQRANLHFLCRNYCQVRSISKTAALVETPEPWMESKISTCLETLKQQKILFKKSLFWPLFCILLLSDLIFSKELNLLPALCVKVKACTNSSRM